MRLQANLYPVLLEYRGEDSEPLETNIGGHVNEIPEEYEHAFWDSATDRQCYYWDSDEEVKQMKAGDHLMDNCYILSIGEPEYVEEELYETTD